jgi:putative PIN family toxin of toxin-antitoxin system
MMRAVLDTNVFVSAVLGHSLGIILEHWKNDDFVLIVTDEIVREYWDVLRRPKFGLSVQIIDPIMAQVFQQAEFVLPDAPINMIEADPSDNKFLEAAITGDANLVVSGDEHLLNLKSFRGISIVTAREFIAFLR